MLISNERMIHDLKAMVDVYDSSARFMQFYDPSLAPNLIKASALAESAIATLEELQRTLPNDYKERFAKIIELAQKAGE